MMDQDVAVGGAGPDLDRRLRLLGAAGFVQRAAHPSVMGTDVQPGCGAFTDADLELTGSGLEHDRTIHDLADPDSAVGRLGYDGGVCTVDADSAIGRLHSQVAGDFPHHGVPVGVLDHRRAPDVTDSHLARAGGDIGVTGGTIHGDVAHAGFEVQRTCVVEADTAHSGFEPALSEAALAAEPTHTGVTLHVRASGQFDCDVDRAASAGPDDASGALVDEVALPALDQQSAAGVLDLGLLGGSDVRCLGAVARPHLDDGVSAVASNDPCVAGAEFDRHEDRFWCCESWHGGAPFQATVIDIPWSGRVMKARSC